MIKWNLLSAEEQRKVLARPALADATSLKQTVSGIIARVQKEGDKAVLALTQEFDKAKLNALALSSDALACAEDELDEEIKAAIHVAYDNIRRFHEAQRPTDITLQTQPGVFCEQRTVALDSVGLYIPGGTAPLPSTVLMLGVPAQVAECRQRILCTPPNSKGQIAAEIRYAAKLCGISQIFLCGGAQAIAAMAFGTASIPKVDKIYGPGNSFVTEAKQQVSTTASGAAIDMPAGPSEVLVLADAYANPAFIAADMLSQAEHGRDSQAVLVCNSEKLINQVTREVDRQLEQLNRNEIARAAMQHGRYILTESFAEAIEVSNAYAPEHLIVQADNARGWLSKIRHAGSVFLGQWSPESAGDYASGTNHVLPTYGYSRMYSSLGLLDFMRRFTVQELTESGFKALAPSLIALSQAEGLDAHAKAVSLRTDALNAKANDSGVSS
ncbi:histidinol dehydrogenase [Alteromonas oceanisediminis]|uniref:histidinol dehydrogenase n=1 Tax=Alteromonas oceanisediminis TaxID=2836180 RepID=UPI001BDAB0EE|nr:histidinol dehydrogenase [Alteromonas oceanisediminis]MBT0587479.1 histidinol dehydrogenase [Alteromonas oceanisediminis]